MHILFADILKSTTGIGHIANRYWWNCVPRKRVGDLANTGRRFGQYQFAIWPIPVGDFRMPAKRICIIYMYVLSNSSILVGDLANTGWQFSQYRLAIWSIPDGDLDNTGCRFGQYRQRYIFQDLGRFDQGNKVNITKPKYDDDDYHNGQTNVVVVLSAWRTL